VPSAATIPADPLTPHEGFAPIAGLGRIWYRVVGTGRGTPLVLIHGGPGGRSCTMRDLDRLGVDRPVIFYDQLGTGRSDRPPGTSYWTLAHFVDELDALRRTLGLREVHLLGRSWGASVALEYVLTKGDSGVRSLTLMAPLVSTPRWIADARALVATLPEPQRHAVAEAERTGQYDAPAFLAANDSFAARYGSRTGMGSSFGDCLGVKGNAGMYRAMWGPTEFAATGTLKDHDRESRLAELRLPVLFVAGEFDEARPGTVRHFSTLVPGSRFVVIPGAAHATSVDAPEVTVAELRRFLGEVEVRR
jgi:proline iminopeptidase